MRNRFYCILSIISVLIFLSGCGSLEPVTTEPADERALKMVKEAERYYNYTSLYGWYVRTSATDTTGQYYDVGMPYSFGNKDTPEDFDDKIVIDELENSIAQWSDYNLCDYVVGLLYDEWANYKQSDPNYLPSNWAGIDCSGLVQRCAYAGGYRFDDKSYQGNIGDGEFNSFGGEIYSQDFNKYFTEWITDDVNLYYDYDKVKAGDIVIYPGHVALVSTIEGSVVKVLNSLGNLDYDPPYQIVECEINVPDYTFNVYRWPVNK